MDTFEVMLLSPQMKSICGERLGASFNVLDLSSDQGRLSMCQQLQTIANSFVNGEVLEPQRLSLDLKGLGSVKASVSYEQDLLLDTYVGSVVVEEVLERKRRRSRSSSSGSIRQLRKTAL